MYNYLAQHPQVVPLKNGTKAFGKKEVRYFNPRSNFRNDFDAYIRENFIPLSELESVNRSTDHRLITGESTPDYIRIPEVPERIRDVMPDVKLIALLRNPVDRAYSHYNHALKLDREKKYTGGNSFEVLAEAELRIIEKCGNFLHGNWTIFLDCQSTAAGKIAEELNIPIQKKRGGRLIWLLQTLYRGLYAPQLRHWLKVFPAHQILVVQSEEMYKDPVKVMDRVGRFLELEPWDWSLVAGKIYNFGERNRVSEGANTYLADEMATNTRKLLSDFFSKYNEEISDLFINGEFPVWQDDA
jgi:hypothetical protein